MFFLKFLSFVSLSLLFMGNVAAAECVDLSGTYSCNGRIVTYTKTSDEGGIFGYSVTTKENGIEKTLPTPIRLLPQGEVPIVTCTGNQIETKIERPNGVIAITTILEEKIFTIRLAINIVGVAENIMEEGTCDRQ